MGPWGGWCPCRSPSAGTLWSCPPSRWPGPNSTGTCSRFWKEITNSIHTPATEFLCRQKYRDTATPRGTRFGTDSLQCSPPPRHTHGKVCSTLTGSARPPTVSILTPSNLGKRNCTKSGDTQTAQGAGLDAASVSASRVLPCF